MTEMNRRSAWTLGAAVLATIAVPRLATAAGAPADELRSFLERFFKAQNAYDPAAVKDTLLDSPEFLWITPRGEVIWGRDAAMQKFEAFYKGTWKIDPEMAQFRAMSLGDNAAQIFIPLVLTAGPPDQPAKPIKIALSQTLVRVGSGWRIASLLPIPVQS